MNHSKMCDVIKRNIPQGMSVACEQIDLCEGDIFQEESIFIEHAIPKRKREFIAGRTCARKALSDIGIHGCRILVGKKREPLWPEGVTGSITHDGNHAVAVVAKTNSISMVGVDLSDRSPLNHELIRMVCTNEEIENINKFSLSDFVLDPFKSIFSIKESVFKCLFPTVQEIFNFNDVLLIIRPDSSTVRVKLINDRIFGDLDPNIRSRFFSIGEHIFSVAWVA